jgi:1,4-dihydroxy-2-naphthoate polyprenyltransferase
MNVEEAMSQVPGYSHAVLIYQDTAGYPFSVATEFEAIDGEVHVTPPLTGSIRPAESSSFQIMFSHIRPAPGIGYDQRRYIELTGSVSIEESTWRFTPHSARGWDENALPFFELCERAVPQARRYLESLSRDRGVTIAPKMGIGWKLFLATRAPFLTATLVPVFLGIAAAAYEHHFSFGLMLLTLLGAISVHLGLNIANDIFDARSGADELNVTPTMFSGGSRVIQYGLVNLRQMVLLSGAFYAVAIVCGLILVARTSAGLLWVGVAGLLISWFYTAPPLKLVHRGLGEVCVALGFGPIMTLGAYYVQTGHYTLRPLILSIPVGLLVMLILYANEIPDRIADASAGKRTLVVRLSPASVIRGYVISVTVAYLTLIAGVVTGVIPWPAIIGLLTIPMAIQTARGLRDHYDRPYEVMAFLQKNVMLHSSTGVLLIAGTLAGHVGS